MALQNKPDKAINTCSKENVFNDFSVFACMLFLHILEISKFRNRNVKTAKRKRTSL